MLQKLRFLKFSFRQTYLLFHHWFTKMWALVWRISKTWHSSSSLLVRTHLKKKNGHNLVTRDWSYSVIINPSRPLGLLKFSYTSPIYKIASESFDYVLFWSTASIDTGSKINYFVKSKFADAVIRQFGVQKLAQRRSNLPLPSSLRIISGLKSCEKATA